MFWRFGGYANVSTIDSILERDNFELEELLDESDLVQELKQHNARLVEYLRDPPVLESLLQYVVAPKLEPVATPEDDDDEDEDEKGKGIALPFTRSRSSSRAAESSHDDIEKKRNRYAFVATEILSSDTWSIYEALMESKPLLLQFWQFLKRQAPLDPLQASYFTKVNESLFDKKTEEMIELLKSMDGAVADILRHVDCPMVMDLLLKIISLERTDTGQGIVEWLYTQNVVPTLLSFLAPEHSWATQTSAADFIKAIITVSANASQNEQTCIGPNELTRQLVSKPCVEQLIRYMLGGGNPLTCGVGIVIEVIRKNNSDYDPEGVDVSAPPTSRDPIFLGTLLRLFAQNVPNFMNLILNAPAQQQRLSSTFGGRIEPLGFDRFKTCELMAELLHCSNMMLLNDPNAEHLISIRDDQRRRLRAEGRLALLNANESAAFEDLSMRSPRGSNAGEEGRKLEVTNVSADDDGFEDLSPTSDLIEKVEASVPMDLSGSPKLGAEGGDSAAEQQPPFEDIDLMVAPLSPSKKAARPEQSEDKQATAAGEGAEGTSSQAEGSEIQKSAQAEPKPAHDEALTSHPVETPSQPQEDAPSSSAAEAHAPVSSSEEGNPPPAEEKPAEPAASEAPPAEAQATPVPDAPAQDPASEPQPAAPAEQPAPQEGEESVHYSGDAPQPPGSPTPKVSVGDYLKTQFVEHRVVPTILGFFFTYPWNNFLHNVVYDIVQQVFNGPMDRGFNPTLAISLFEAADITNRIIAGQRASEASQAATRTRMGFMGHLTLIAEEVVKFTERHPPEMVSEVVLEKVMAPDWVSYVEGALAETRERDNAILGGVRPEVAMSNRAAAQGLMGAAAFSGLSSIGLGAVASNALAEAGLNGGGEGVEGGGGGGGGGQGGSGAGGAGPFAISAGTLMSGFGSSSDEEDDEEQETEEDVNNEFRAYTDPLNANSNLMNPPSIPPPPPPPPPLNIAPSRARLQLAARLAMNKRNAAAAAAANGSGSGQEGGAAGSPPGAEGTSGMFNLASHSGSGAGERLRNPFADYEDDDEDESGSGSDDGENVEGEDLGEATAASSSGWNRGSWWRGVVRTARGGGGGARRRLGEGEGVEMEGDVAVERFGDGRDDDSSDEEGGRRMRRGGGVGGEEEDEDDDIEDEEFGDFAMPEVGEGGGAGGGRVSGIDPARESILVKPMPLHPASALKSSVGPFSSLWPFSRDNSATGAGKKGGDDDDDETTPTATNASSSLSGRDAVPLHGATTGASGSSESITDEPVELTPEEEAVLSEDGKRIDRAVEATRRTSIEDPDDDEDEDGVVRVVARDGLDVGGEEIVVHHARDHGQRQGGDGARSPQQYAGVR